MKKYAIYIMLSLVSLAFLSSCEDDTMKDYVSKDVVEAFLLVDEPIENIMVMKSQEIFKEYKQEDAIIRNAQVIIKGDNQVFNLTISPSGVKGYYNPDKSYLVKPNTEYKLEVVLNDGKVLYGKTITPDRTEWVTRPSEFVQFPNDLDDARNWKDSIAWKAVKGVDFYYLNMVCADTLNYGSYLNPATNEKNEKVDNYLKDDDLKELSINPIYSNNRAVIPWNFFLWYGKQVFTVYAMDKNMEKWYWQSFQTKSIKNAYNTIQNGYGCFGSASIARDTFVLLKGNPKVTKPTKFNK
jgi:hypothetical protein